MAIMISSAEPSYRFGHSGIFMPMPEGILTQIDAERLSIELIEPVVK